MKKLLVISFVLTVVSFSSCYTDCDCPPPVEAYMSEYQLYKAIVETNTTNMSTGLESVFNTTFTDSLSRAHLCQTIIDNARFYGNESGYFFIETLNDAWVVAHINHDLIGTSRIDIQDENGKYFIREMVETVKYSGFGFIEYYRKNPSTNQIEHKMSFVTSIPSAQWFIGTGFYGNPPKNYYDYIGANGEIIFNATTTMAKSIGGVFADIIEEDDEKIEFCRNFIDHIRFYDDGSGYFFINDFNGINIAHGANKEYEGENDIDLQDSRGAYIIRDMIELARLHGNGYYQYYWNNPVTEAEEIKIVYVSRIPDTDYFIASGFYVK